MRGRSASSTTSSQRYSVASRYLHNRSGALVGFSSFHADLTASSGAPASIATCRSSRYKLASSVADTQNTRRPAAAALSARAIATVVFPYPPPPARTTFLSDVIGPWSLARREFLPLTRPGNGGVRENRPGR